MKSKNVYFKKVYYEYLSGYGLKNITIKRMKSQLKRFYSWLNGRDIREIDFKQILTYMKYLFNIKSQYNKSLASSSIQSFLSTLKSFFLFLYQNEYILSNPMEDMPVTQRCVKKKKNIFNNEEINDFLDSIKLTFESYQRDRAIFELMYSSGLRLCELVNLELEDIKFDERILIIKEGKGGKDRYTPFSNTALQFMLKYVESGRHKHLKSIKDVDAKKYMFLTPRGKLTTGMMSRRIKKYLIKCGLDKNKLTLYSIRHSVATHLLENGASIRYVAELLGHESLTTTQIYTNPTDENIKKVYKTHHPRENEYYEEISPEYLDHLDKLKHQILSAREKKRKKKLQIKV